MSQSKWVKNSYKLTLCTQSKKNKTYVGSKKHMFKVLFYFSISWFENVKFADNF